MTKRHIDGAVVDDQGEFDELERSRKIGQRAWESLLQLVDRNVVATLGGALLHAQHGKVGAVDADETDAVTVAGSYVRVPLLDVPLGDTVISLGFTIAAHWSPSARAT